MKENFETAKINIIKFIKLILPASVVAVDLYAF